MNWLNTLCLRTVVPEIVDIYKDDKIFLKTTQASMRNIPIGQDYLLKKWTQKQGLANQTYWIPILIGMQKPPKN